MISRDEQHENVVGQYELPHPFDVVSRKRKRNELDDQHPIQPMISQSTGSVIANSIGEQIPSSGTPLANGHATSSRRTADAHQSPLLHRHNQSLILDGPQPSISPLHPLG